MRIVISGGDIFIGAGIADLPFFIQCIARYAAVTDVAAVTGISHPAGINIRTAAGKADIDVTIIRSIADDGQLLDVQALYAKNIITCFIRLGGRTVGVIASQPKIMAGSGRSFSR